MTFSHELKFRRAFAHLKEIDKLSREWLDGSHHTTRFEEDLKDGTRVYFATAEQPPEDPLSLWIGEFLHNMRSGLDNLAFSLASAFTNPLPDDFAESSEMPIFGDHDRQGKPGMGSARFSRTTPSGDPARGSGLDKIRGWAPGAQTVIEGLQPYHRGNAFAEDPLWRLHELDRVNKHRLLHATFANGAGFGLDMGRSRNVQSLIAPSGREGRIESLGGPVTTDTPIARMDMAIVPIDPDQEMHVEIQPRLHIAFAAGTPIVESETVYLVLREVYTHAVGTVVPALVPYL